MEAASKMDVQNATIQKELAEMALTAGQVEKAERTYRALLLVVRRTPPGDDETKVGPSEVLFELHKLATSRGDKDQAKELRESAMEAAVQSDAEIRRLRRSLLAHGEGELLLEVLNRRLGTNPEPHRQARLLSDMAEMLDGLGRGPDALEALIKAIGVMPSRTDLHERARELAKKHGQTKRFVDAVESVVDRLRRKDDPPLIANLLMRAGESLEQDANDLKGAANLYRRVEIMGERLAEVFYAQARVASALGDTAEQARTLDKMFELAGLRRRPTPQQVDALTTPRRSSSTARRGASRRRSARAPAPAAEPRWGTPAACWLAARQAGWARLASDASRATEATATSSLDFPEPRRRPRRRSRSAKRRRRIGGADRRRGAARPRRRRRATPSMGRRGAVGRARPRRAPARCR